MKEKLIWLCANHTIKSVMEQGENYIWTFFPEKRQILNYLHLFRIGLYTLGVNAFHSETHPARKFMNIPEKGVDLYRVDSLRDQIKELALYYEGDTFFLRIK